MSVDDLSRIYKRFSPKPPELVASETPDLEGALLIVTKLWAHEDVSIDQSKHAGLKAGAVSAGGSAAARDAPSWSATTGKVLVKIL